MDICLQQTPGAEGNLIFVMTHPDQRHCRLHICLVMFCPQTKLAEGLNLAKEFHSNVQELLLKMCKCEESMALLPAPSFVLDTVCSQLQDHRVGFVLNSSCLFFFCLKGFTGSWNTCLYVQKLVSEVNNYGEVRNAVEGTARRLTELSRKEDCDVIHNLMMIVLDRHKKLQLRAAERGRILEEVKKNAKQVNLEISGSITGCVTRRFLCATFNLYISVSWILASDDGLDDGGGQDVGDTQGDCCVLWGDKTTVDWAEGAVAVTDVITGFNVPSLLTPLLLKLGVPETAEVKKAHVRSLTEEWTQPSWSGSNQPGSAASGKFVSRTQRHMGHYKWQVHGEVTAPECFSLFFILFIWNSTHTWTFFQTTQAGGSTTILRTIHWCSPGPERLAVQSRAPTGWRCSC